MFTLSESVMRSEPNVLVTRISKMSNHSSPLVVHTNHWLGRFGVILLSTSYFDCSSPSSAGPFPICMSSSISSCRI
jgi:hypothetical protein